MTVAAMESATEGFRRLNTFKARSDKTPPKATIEPQRQFRCVRRDASAGASNRPPPLSWPHCQSGSNNQSAAFAAKQVTA